MKTNKEVLTDILVTAQLGQVGIRSVLDTTMQPGLRSTLRHQLQEYDSIETEALSIAAQRGWDLRELEAGRKFFTDRMFRLRLGGRNTDSKIADMLIRGSTRGIIQGLQNIHQFSGSDQRVQILSQKLLDCENANIQQMQYFL